MRRLLACALLICGTATPALAAMPPPVKAAAQLACTAQATLHDYAALLTPDPTLVAAATRFLPDDGTAALEIHRPLNAGNGPPDYFAVFESATAWPDGFATDAPLAIIGIVPAPASAAPAFDTIDSTQLQFQTAPSYSAPWRKHYFTVVDCEGGNVVAWGGVSARVTDPGYAAAICLILAALVYFGCMLCLQDKRKPGGSALFRRFRKVSTTQLNTQAYFAKTYPALFQRQELSLWQLLNPIHLMVNDVGVPSVQKAQVILFSSLVVGLLLYLVLRIGNLVSLSGSVVGLIGISGVSAAASGGVTQQNKRLSFDNWAWLQQQNIIVQTGEVRPARWSDLLTTNHEFDIYKMQALVFSVVVAFALFIAGAGGELATFSVPDALLGVLGLSQVTYIGGLLTQPPAVADLDVALSKLRGAYDSYGMAVNQGTDVDADGHMVAAPAVAPAVAGFNAKAQFNKQVVTIVPMIESALEVQVNRASPALQPLP